MQDAWFILEFLLFTWTSLTSDRNSRFQMWNYVVHLNGQKVSRNESLYSLKKGSRKHELGTHFRRSYFSMKYVLEKATRCLN